MSKSLNNFFLVRDILKDYDGETLRYFLLSAQYRGPINFSRELMDAAKASLERMRNCKRALLHLMENGTSGSADESKYQQFKDKYIAAMDDDLNTADAISAVFELISEINKEVAAGMSKEQASAAYKLLDELTGVLGLLRQDKKEEEIDDELKSLIEQRAAARAAKNWAEADRIRDLLAAKGITLKDTKDGVQIIRN